MSTVQVDAATAAKLSEPKTTVEVRTEDGKLVGVFTPRREATDEDYEWAMKQFTPDKIEAAEKSGPCRPASEIIPELIRKFGLMKFTVVNAPIADQQLADIWLKATDRQAVADAFDRIESSLKNDPQLQG